MKITTERRILHNLPVRVFTTNGSPWDYEYDHEGNRVRTYNGMKTNYYINACQPSFWLGIDGKTEVITDKASTWATYNLYGLDLIGQVRREGATWNRYYFLKDHLGSVRVIVDASGNVVVYDDYYPFACPPCFTFWRGRRCIGGRSSLLQLTADITPEG